MPTGCFPDYSLLTCCSLLVLPMNIYQRFTSSPRNGRPSSVLFRAILPLALLTLGVWLLGRPSAPAAESPQRTQALRLTLNGVTGSQEESPARPISPGPVTPVLIDLADVPVGVYDDHNLYERWQRGAADLERIEGLYTPAEIAALQAAAYQLEPDPDIQIMPEPAPSQPVTPPLPPAGSSLVYLPYVTRYSAVPVPGAAFPTLDIDDCCGGAGATVPPDPQLAAGSSHLIAVTNVAFAIYNKLGGLVYGPLTFASFFSALPNCQNDFGYDSFPFDPNVLYDEEKDRYFLAVDYYDFSSNLSIYCVAVSRTNNPAGQWWLYEFSMNQSNSSLWMDYPHAGIGRDAIYVGGNMFTFWGNWFSEGRVWALDKNDLYAGATTTLVERGLGSSKSTPQPANLHGYGQGTWPTSGPHYFLAQSGSAGDDVSVLSWNDPFGANTLVTVGTVDLNVATGVTAGFPVDADQSGGGDITANDWRPLDFEYRNGYGWTVMNVACNPGSGTVDCVRWAQIDLDTASVVQAGVFSSDSHYRLFPDVAVNHCDDVLMGYTRTSSSTYPGIWTAGRRRATAAGELETSSESLLKGGEISYDAFDDPPHRWGDYTGMTIDPDGRTFWYLGEYSKNTGNVYGRWGTYIGSFTYAGCNT